MKASIFFRSERNGRKVSHLQQFERLSLDIRTVGFEGWVRLPRNYNTQLHEGGHWGHSPVFVLQTEILCWLADDAGLAAISTKIMTPFKCKYTVQLYDNDIPLLQY